MDKGVPFDRRQFMDGNVEVTVTASDPRSQENECLSPEEEIWVRHHGILYTINNV